MRAGKLAAVLTLVAWIACSGTIVAQTAWQPAPRGIGFGQQKSKQWVQLVSSSRISIKAAATAPTNVYLRFTIQDGLHINSHTPHSSFLIPTVLTLGQISGVQVAQIDYPNGADYHFQFSPKDALSVYTGEFAVQIHLRARAGRYIIHGHLHYQACDDRTCNPPRMLPVQLEITAN
ncbi:MAG: protein-disulfide reductase DsbD domain-containing protein [Acidobacteriaceae bacterium]